MEQEFWKWVIGYEHNYKVSNLGRVKSMNFRGNTKTEHILKQSYHNLGYLQLELCKGGISKKFKTHVLVANAFLGKDDSLVVDHKNGKKDDNRLKNLRRLTHRENVTDANVNRHKTSKYAGVCYDKEYKKWRAKISIKGIISQSKRFLIEEDARDWYLKKLKTI